MTDRKHTGRDVSDAGGTSKDGDQPMDTGEGGHEPVAIGDFLDDALAQIGRRKSGAEEPLRLPSEWAKLTAALDGGLWPGLYVLVGNTASGKTQFALQAALAAAQRGTQVLYVGLELDNLQIACRLLGLMSGVPWSELYLGKYDPDLFDGADMQGHQDALRGLPFTLQTAPPHGWHYGDLYNAAKGVHQKGAPLLVVVDFLQLVSGGQDAGDGRIFREPLRERITQAAYTGRAVARDFGAAVMMISSTAREHYGTLAGEVGGTRNNPGTPLGEGDAGRLIGLGKESGDVEYAADTLLVLARGKGNVTWCAVAKRRCGQPAWARMSFDGARGSFADGEEPVSHGETYGTGGGVTAEQIAEVSRVRGTPQ